MESVTKTLSCTNGTPPQRRNHHSHCTHSFYYDRAADRWKQVWLTDRAFRRGGTKEKIEQPEHTSVDQVVFQGRHPDPESGATITDRTTLSRRADGTLRHLIEISTDEGKTWRTTFEGIYRAARR